MADITGITGAGGQIPATPQSNYVTGVGTVPLSEATSPEVIQKYIDLMSKLSSTISEPIFSKGQDPNKMSNEQIHSLLEVAYNRCIGVMSEFAELAKHGIKSPSGTTSYLTGPMAQELSHIFDRFQQEGFNIGQPYDHTDLRKNIQAFNNIDELVRRPIAPPAELNKTLAMNTMGLQTMLLFVLNNAMEGWNKKLSTLHDEMTANQAAAATLNQTQQLRNNCISPTTPIQGPAVKYPLITDSTGGILKGPPLPTPPGFQKNFDYTIQKQQYDDFKAYNDSNVKAGGVGNLPIPPTVNVTVKDVQALLQQRQNYKDQLANLAKVGITPGGENPNLADQLQKVVQDIDSAFEQAGLTSSNLDNIGLQKDFTIFNAAIGGRLAAGAYQYMMDGQAGAMGSKGKGGDIANNLANATTASQNLSDQEKSQLNIDNYNLQQIQTMVASILKEISDAIKNSAQAAGRT